MEKREPYARLEVISQVSRRTSSSRGAPDIVYTILLVPGVFLSLSALGIYAPVDNRPPMAILLGLFLLPVALYVVSSIRSRPIENPVRGRTTYLCSAVALIVFAVMVFLNGKLDKSPEQEVRARVINKTSYTVSRGGRRYLLTVASWRPGRSTEAFNVAKGVFDRTQPGKDVSIEVHQGFFGLPWRGKISP